MIMETWKHGKPNNLKELFDFYHKYVKLLYSEIQAENVLPADTIFEVNAAFDHVATHWTYGISEESAVADAFGHLKRSCLDSFKYKFVRARQQYDALCKIDTSVIDNGEYSVKLHKTFNEMRTLATKARSLEGKADDDKAVPAFEVWEDVYVKCVKFQDEFYLHPRLNWAKRKGFWNFVRQNFWAIILGILTSLAATYIWFRIVGL
jgi:hypothetical protein